MPKNIQPLTTELIINAREHRRSFCETFVYEPENIDEEALGRLMVVGEIESSKDNQLDQISLLNSIAAKLQRRFFQSAGRRPIEAFEASLKLCNDFLAQEYEKGRWEWLAGLHLGVVVILSDIVIFSKSGRLRAMLRREDEVVDLFKDAELDHGISMPLRPFRTTFQGRIAAGQRLVFFTPQFSKDLSKETLTTLIFNLNAENVSSIKNTLQSRYKITHGAFVLIELMEQEELEERRRGLGFLAKKAEKQEAERLSWFTARFKYAQFVSKLARGLLSVLLKALASLLKVLLSRYLHKKFSPKPRPALSGQIRKATILFSVVLIATGVFFVTRSLMLPIKDSSRPSRPTEFSAKITLSAAPFVDFSRVSLTGEPEHVDVTPEGLFVFDEQSIWKIDPASKNVIPILPELDVPYQLGQSAVVGSEIYFISSTKNDTRLLVFETKKSSLATIRVLQAQEFLSRPVAAARFDNNIYVLVNDPKAEIYRINLARSSPLKAEAWFKERPEDFMTSRPVDLAIDGFIYLIDEKGLVAQFRSGSYEPSFNITLPGPLQTQPGKMIMAEPDTPTVMIFIKPKALLLEYDKKTGELLTSYRIADGGGFRDLDMDLDARQGYGLTVDNQVVKIVLPDLELITNAAN